MVKIWADMWLNGGIFTGTGSAMAGVCLYNA